LSGGPGFESPSLPNKVENPWGKWVQDPWHKKLRLASIGINQKVSCSKSSGGGLLYPAAHARFSWNFQAAVFKRLCQYILPTIQ